MLNFNGSVTDPSLWLSPQPIYHSKEVCCQCLLSQECSLPNTNSIQIKIKELLRFCCGCHGSLVTNATKFVADLFCPK